MITDQQLTNNEEQGDKQETSTPVFDKAGMLERLMNDENILKMVVNVFLEDMPKQIETLKTYLDSGDREGSERQAHTIKGASANVGGEALRELAFSMEKAGKAGDLEAVRAKVPELEAQFDQLKKVMTD